MEDPYGIFAVVLSPTRELAQQIHEQVCALGSVLKVQSVLVCGGGDFVRQSCALQKQPHFLVATPGRLGEMMRNNAAAIKAGGKSLIKLNNVRFVVLDEADRLLSKNGFEKDVAEILSCTSKSRRCQTILFSATMTASLDEVSNMASGGRSRLPLQQFTVTADGELKENDSSSSGGEDEENDNSDGDSDSDSDGDNSNNTNSTNTNTNTIGSARIPAGLSQQYIFMPSKMRDVYLVSAIKALIENGGLKIEQDEDSFKGSGWTTAVRKDNDDDEEEDSGAKSAIIFVDKCERAAYLEGTFQELGIHCVALHSLLSQDRRMAALGKFKSQQVRILVATDVASRGLDIPEVDLVLNAELPRRPDDYIHRVGRTARAGRRGLAVSLVSENDISLIHACEDLSGRKMDKCEVVKDKDAVKIMSSVSKASRLTKVKLLEIGFDKLVKKRKERKVNDNRQRQNVAKQMRKIGKK